MKLSLKKILNELKPTSNVDVPYQPPAFGHAKTMPGPTSQQKPSKEMSTKQKVDQGKPEMQQTAQGDFYYQGGVLHRMNGPAVVPRGAKVRRLQGGTEMAEGGEYYLYGKRFPDFAEWYKATQHLRQDPEIHRQMQRRARFADDEGPATSMIKFK